MKLWRHLILSSTETYVTILYRSWHSCKGTHKIAVRPPDERVGQGTQRRWGQVEEERLTFCGSHICALCSKHSTCIISFSSYFKDKECETQKTKKTCLASVGSHMSRVTSQVHSQIQFWPQLEAFLKAHDGWRVLYKCCSQVEVLS